MLKIQNFVGNQLSTTNFYCFVAALEDAIDVVNSSYVLYLKNTKPYRTFSVMCSPIYLPFDVTMAAVVRYVVKFGERA